MMYPVMAGAYKNSFEPAGHLVDILCMYQYAVGLGCRKHKNNIQWCKPQ